MVVPGPLVLKGKLTVHIVNYAIPDANDGNYTLNLVI